MIIYSIFSTLRDIKRFRIHHSRFIVIGFLFILCLTVCNQTSAQCTAKIGSNISPIEGCEILTVLLSDSSTGIISQRTWNFGDGTPTTGTQNPNHKYDAGVVGDTTYTLYLAIGCTDGSKDTAFTTVTVKAKPKVDFAMSKTSVCSVIDSVCFTDNSITTVNSTYFWNFGDFANSTVEDPCHIYYFDDSLTVTLTVTDNNNCQGSYSSTVIVNEAPSPEFEVSTFTGCAPLNVTFTNTTNELTSPVTQWIWDFGDGSPLSNVKTPASKVYNTQGNFVISLTAINSTGCKNTTTRAISVISTPAISISSSDVDGLICQNEPVLFTAQPSNLGKYQFYDNFVLLQDSNINTFSTTALKNGSKIYMVLNTPDCAVPNSDTLQFIVKDSLKIPEINCGATTFNSIEFTWEAVPGAVGYLVREDSGAFISPSSGNMGLVHQLTNLTINDSIYLNVIVSGDPPCGDSYMSATKLCKAITCDPIEFYVPKDTSICSGDSVELHLQNLISPSNKYAIKWRNQAWSKDTIYKYLPSADEVITVLVRDSSQIGCENISKSINLTLIPIPVIVLSSTALNDTACSNNLPVFSASPSIYETYKYYNSFQTLQEGANPSFATINMQSGDSIYAMATSKNCKSLVQKKVTFLTEPMSAPQLYCGQTDTNYVQFEWDSILNATGYEISVNNSIFLPPTLNSLSLLERIDSLSFLDSVYAVVRALGRPPCGNSINSARVVCFAKTCGEIKFDKSPDTTVCQYTNLQLSVSNISTVSGIPKIGWNGQTAGTDTLYSFLALKDTIIEVAVYDSIQPECAPIKKYFNIKVTPLPVADLTTGLSGDSSCLGDTVTFKAVPSMYDNFEFFRNGVSISSGQSPFLTLIDLQDKDSLSVKMTNKACSFQDTAKAIYVVNPLPLPALFCGETTDSTVEFFWETIPGATGYEISTDAINFNVPTSGSLGLNHLITGLAKGDTVELAIHALGKNPCGNSINSAILSCLAFPCSKTNFTVTPNVAGCMNDTIKLKVTNIETPSSQFAINWNGTFITKDSVLSHVVLKDSVIVISLIDSSQSNCPIISKTINVVMKSLPTVDLSTTNLSDTLCEGEIISLSALPAGYEGYRFLFENATVQHSTSNQLDSLSMTQSGAFYVVTENLGCKDTSNQIAYINVPKPAISLTVSDLDTTICVGDSLFFTVEPDSYDQYQFFKNNTSFLSDTSNKLESNDFMDKDSVYVVGVNPAGCTSAPSEAIHVTVNTMPKLTLSSVPKKDTVCFGDSLLIWVSPALLDRYTIFFNNNIISDTTYNGLNKVFTEPGSFKVIAYDRGCTDSSNVLPIALVEKPIFNLTASDTIICEGKDVSFNISPDGYNNYNYYRNGSLLGTDTLPQFNIQDAADQDTFYVLGVNPAGCQRISSNSIRLEVNAIPVNDFTISPNDTICSGDTLKINVQTPGYDFYEYYVDTVLFKKDTSNKLTIIVDKNYLKIYVIADNKSCRSKDSVLQNVYMKELPRVKVTGDSLLCIGDTAKLLGSGALKYIWDSGQFDSAIYVVPTSSQFYIVRGKNELCIGLPDSQWVAVDENKPIAEAGEDFVLCVGDSIQLSGTGGMYYLWTPLSAIAGPDDISNPYVAVDSNITIHLKTWNLKCEDYDSLQVTSDRCLLDLTDDQIPQFFTPNGDGVNDNWNIQEIDYFRKSELLIINKWGYKVYESKNYLNNWDGKNEQGVDLPDGMYFYQLSLGNGVPPKTGYILIQR